MGLAVTHSIKKTSLIHTIIQFPLWFKGEQECDKPWPDIVTVVVSFPS